MDRRRLLVWQNFVRSSLLWILVLVIAVIALSGGSAVGYFFLVTGIVLAVVRIAVAGALLRRVARSEAPPLPIPRLGRLRIGLDIGQVAVVAVLDLLVIIGFALGGFGSADALVVGIAIAISLQGAIMLFLTLRLQSPDLTDTTAGDADQTAVTL